MRPPTAASAKTRAWKAFSEYIRLKDKTCATCTSAASQAGHYNHNTDKGSNPNLGGNALWYCEKNVHGQCSACNLYKSGNLAEYALFLEDRYGDGILQELYTLRRTPKKWTIEELLEIETKYKALVDNLTKENNQVYT